MHVKLYEQNKDQGVISVDVNIPLSTGEPQTFTLSVNPARNYPLDMYFLVDLSGSQGADLDSLRSLSNVIGE